MDVAIPPGNGSSGYVEKCARLEPLSARVSVRKDAKLEHLRSDSLKLESGV